MWKERRKGKIRQREAAKKKSWGRGAKASSRARRKTVETTEEKGSANWDEKEAILSEMYGSGSSYKPGGSDLWQISFISRYFR